MGSEGLDHFLFYWTKDGGRMFPTRTPFSGSVYVLGYTFMHCLMTIGDNF